MAQPKLGTSKSNKPMHYAVGALIKNGSKYLLIDRAITPHGYAGLAGHIDKNESASKALVREVKEESGLKVTKHKLLYKEELEGIMCSRGVNVHYWFLFECKVTGKIKRNFAETKSIGYYTKEEIASFELEPSWKYWFQKLGVI